MIRQSGIWPDHSGKHGIILYKEDELTFLVAANSRHVPVRKDMMMILTRRALIECLGTLATAVLTAPVAHAQQTIAAEPVTNAKFGYSKRVQRNNNFELNPIPEREHSETLEQGDPDLLPQFVDLVELGMNHTFKKGTLFTTLYYQNIKNPIQRVNSVYADTILNRLFTNAEKARLFGLEFGTNIKPVKWMSIFVGGNIYNYYSIR